MSNDCTRCILHKTTSNVCIPGRGTLGGIMLIGEAPGAEEEREGKPFVGAAGGRLNEALVKAGIYDSVFITNTVRCRPPLNRTPSAAESSACLPYLLEEIQRVQPRAIVLLGNAALQVLTDNKSITAARGRLLTPKRGIRIDVPLHGTFHPAATLYDRRNWEPFVEDLTRIAATLTAGEATNDAFEVRIAEDTTTDEAAATKARLALGRLIDAKVLSCDLEWTAGPPSGNAKADMIWPWRRDPKGEVYSVSLSGRDAAGIIHTVGLRWPLTGKTREAFEYLISHKPTIFHNAMADILWLKANGVPFKLGGDTLVLSHLLDETQPKGLEAACSRYLPELPAWKATTQRLHTRRPLSLHEWDELLMYNCRDAHNTLLLHEAMLAAAHASGRVDAIRRVYIQLILPTILILADAALLGMPLNAELLAKETGLASGRLDEAVLEMARITGLDPRKAVKIATSPDQTLSLLKDALGLDVDSSRKDILAEYKHIPAVAAISKIRKESKYLSTYFNPWLEMLRRQGDRRLHTIYRPVGTRSGRLSAEVELGGSAHVAPRDDERVDFRAVIEADPGRLILSIDESQIELRVLAFVARDPTMLAIYERDRGLPPGVIRSDLHLRTAIENNRIRALDTVAELGYPGVSFEQAVAILMDDIERTKKLPGWKKHRQDAKGVNFGYAYGMRESKFVVYARTSYGVEFTMEEAHAAREAYMAAYTRIPLWHDEVLRSVAQAPFTVTMFGRYRTYEEEDRLSAINNLVQSAASDITLLGMIQTERGLRAEGLDARIIGTIHDSIMIDVSEKDAERAKEIGLYNFENIDTSAFGFTIPVPIKAEAKLGRTW